MESSKNRGRSTPASASNSGTRRASSFPCRLHLGCPRMSHFRLRSNRLELAQRTRRLVRSRLMPASAGYSATRLASSFPCRLHLGCFAAYICMVAARAGKRGREWPRGSRYSRPSRGLEVSDGSHFASTAGSKCITIPVDPSAFRRTRALRETRFNLARLTILSNLSRRRHA